MTSERRTIFISPAPDRQWLRHMARRSLSMAGYRVWCDQQKLLGGEDLCRHREHAAHVHCQIWSWPVLQIFAMATDSCALLSAKKLRYRTTPSETRAVSILLVPARIEDMPFDEFGTEFIWLNRKIPNEGLHDGA